MEVQAVITRICCLCNKVKSVNGWVEQDGSLESLLSHGYCPQCYVKVLERIKGRRCFDDSKNKPA